jgi:outer membrane protein
MKNRAFGWLRASPGLAVVLIAAAGLAVAGPQLDPGKVTLQAAEAYALEHNPELLAMQEETRMAAARERMAVADNRLQASVNGYASAATLSHMALGPAGVMPEDMQMLDPGQSLYGTLTFFKPLSTGGRAQANILRQRRLVAASAADVEALRLRVAYLTRAAYRQVLLRLKTVAAYDQELVARQEMLRDDQVRYDAGKVPLYYMLRDKSALAETQQNLANAHRDVEAGMYDLSLMLGLEPRELTLTDALAYVPVESDRDQALKDAAARRPELAAARARLEAAAADTRAAAAAYRPQVAARVLVQAMTNDDMGSQGGYTAAVVVGLPLLDGGSRAAEVEMAKAAQAQLTQRERQVALQVAREVLGAVADLKAGEASVRAAMEATAAAEEDFRVASLRYDAGKAINLEPLDALAGLVRARLNLAQALYDHSNAVDQLAWARGAAAQ